MNFNTLEFFALFLGFSLIYFPLAGIPALRNALLFFGGVGFLGMASPEAAGVFLAVTLVSFAVAAAIHQSHGRGRALWLALGLAFHCAAIVYFRWRRLAEGPLFPLGLSFYSFVCMGYLVELTRGRVGWLSPGAYFSGIAFFPSLAAGPLSHLADLSQKIASPTAFRLRTDFAEALTLVANGLMKKAVAEYLWQASRGHPMLIEEAPGRMAWIKLCLFIARFYADFSGYSDIARGIALFFGVRLPENFLQPFFASSLSDYWNRWHVTLTAWIRTYVFLPLLFSFPMWRGAGSAVSSRWRATVATFSTMLIFGIWHDLTLTFLLYGIYMGALLAAELWWVPWRDPRIPVLLRRACLLFLLANSFVFYMHPDWASVRRQFEAMYSPSGWGSGSIGFSYLILILLSLPGIHLLDWWLSERNFWRGRLAPALVWSSLALGLHFYLTGLSGVPFVYFQF